MVKVVFPLLAAAARTDVAVGIMGRCHNKAYTTPNLHTHQQ
ncbi:hypothetical protein [Candidatus Cardinium hertigii]|nr:hypothetical protein [Candidatus Cardinium hertigii]